MPKPPVTIPADLAREVAKIADPRVRADYERQLRKHAEWIERYDIPVKWDEFRRWVAGERKKGRK